MKRGIVFLIFMFCGFVSHVYATCLPSLPSEAPDGRYQLQGNTVLDRHTGLIWQRCALGQVWLEAEGRCQLQLELPRLFTWPEALAQAHVAVLAGNDDWRLPNKNELNSLVDRACTGPAINETVFPDTHLGGFWSSTPARHSANFAWQVDFTVGTLIAFDMTQRFSVRLVRHP